MREALRAAKQRTRTINKWQNNVKNKTRNAERNYWVDEDDNYSLNSSVEEEQNKND